MADTQVCLGNPRLPFIAAIIVFAFTRLLAAQTPPSPITEFPIPYPQSFDPKNPAPTPHPISMTAGPDGNLWFTQSGRSKIGRITPAGVFSEFSVPSGAYWITTGSDGNLWFTTSTTRVGRMTLTGVVTEFAIPEVARQITAGPDGNLWFTTQICGANCMPMIGRMDVNGGLTTFTPPGDVGAGDIGMTSVRGITSGPDGNIWFTLAAGGYQPVSGPAVPSYGRIGRITPAGTVTEFPASGFLVGSRFGGITTGPDGNLWFTDSGGYPESGKIGRSTPTGDITLFPIPLVASVGGIHIDHPNTPSTGTLPEDIVAGPDGRLWFTDQFYTVVYGSGQFCCDGSGRIGRVTVTGQFTQFPIRSHPCPFITAGALRCGYPSGITVGPDGHLWFAHAYSSRIMRIAGDVEPAGNAGLVWRDTTTGDVGLWSLSGASVRSETLLATSLPLEWHVAATGDLDGNGTDDLVWRHSQTGGVAAWLMTGVTVTAIPVISASVSLEWHITGLGDVNGDGNADVVWRNMRTGGVALWWMDGATVTGIPVVASGVPLAWQIAGLADLDGDGKDDLVWRHGQTGDVAVWLMDAETIRQGPVIGSGVPLAWQISGLGDLNGDGRADLAWRHTHNGDVAAWLMNGTTITQAPVIASGLPLQWRMAKVVDVDGNGRADLVWRRDAPTSGETLRGEVAIWLMDGATPTQVPVIRDLTEVITTSSGPRWQIQ